MRTGRSWLKETFWLSDGGKNRPNFKSLAVYGYPLGTLIMFTVWIGGAEDTTYVRETSSPAQVNTKAISQSAENSHKVSGLSIETVTRTGSGQARPVSPNKNVKFRAPQVIVRKGVDPSSYMPPGTNMIGRLLVTVDSRSKQLIKVLLPYGGSFRRDRRIAKNSILFGTISYPGRGDKVYFQFNRGVTPGGKEFKVQATALDSSDFSPGLIGEHHGNAGGRLAATVGLSMLSAGSGVLIEKESLNEGVEATPKATVRNAALAGVSRGAEMEAQRHADEISNKSDYVTLPAGSDLIVSLTESFRGDAKD